MTIELLQVKDLRKYFPLKGGLLGRQHGAVYAVDGVSLSLRRGETLGLVGESGCGKSTLGRTIMRLYEPTAGSVQFDGMDFTRLSAGALRAQRRNIQMIFQDPFSSLNPRMKVSDILAEPFRIHSLASGAALEREVRQLLEVVGLDSAAVKKYPHEFSGGQRQRIGIARAIALRPKLVIADEPVSALDVSIQSQILNLLVQLRRQLELSYLFIAHDLAVIEHISDTIAVMYLGKIVEYTSSEQLYKRPLHPYTQALIASIPVPEVKPERRKLVLSGDVPSPISPPSGCHFHPRCPQASQKCKVERPELRNLGTPQHPHWVSCHYA